MEFIGIDIAKNSFVVAYPGLTGFKTAEFINDAKGIKKFISSFSHSEYHCVMDHHLEENKASGENNRKNGKTKKTVRSLQSGHFELESSRDRNGTFEPKIVPKRQLIITSELENNVIAMYARGM